MAIVVGDIHGNMEKVRAFLNYRPAQEHVAVGDYLDSFTVPFDTQMECLQLLIGSDAVLLWGNHDLHYLKSPLFQYPGYQLEHAETLQNLLEENINRFKPSCIADGWLCTHAGVHAGIVKGRSVQELDKLFNDEWNLYLQDRARDYRLKSIFKFDFMAEGTLAPENIKQIFGHDELSDAAFVNPNCVSIACTDKGVVFLFDTEANDIVCLPLPQRNKI